MSRFLTVTLLAAAAISDWRVLAASLPPSVAFPFSPGFDIQKVADIAQSLPSHSWEYGTAAEALLELYDPSVSVFGDSPFPVPTIAKEDSKSLSYIATKFQLGAKTLINGDGAVGDPASLGVSALLLGKTNATLADAAQRQLTYVVKEAPRFWNGAISHRADYPELWADFMYMAPPFIAYYGAAYDDLSLLQEAVDQATKYRQVLHDNTTLLRGAWQHIIGPVSGDPGLWSTGNAWAAAGMMRVWATILKAPIACQHEGWQHSAINQLRGYIREILDAAIDAPTQDKLIINYWNDAANTDKHGYGEISGTTLLASVAYRFAVLNPGWGADSYVSWADEVRQTLGGTDSQNNPHITANGTATPAVNPLNWYDTQPWTAGSPEGNNFVVLMYTAWRDCVQAQVCNGPYY